MAKTNTIGVFFGSRSPEHDISIITGGLIITGLKKLGIPVVPVYIGKTGAWYIGAELGELKNFTRADFDVTTGGFDKYSIDLEKSRGKMVFQKHGFRGKTVSIDIAFPALHGSYGEDGTIQGLFEMFNLPYIGCDVPSSALAMDKVLTKMIYEQHAIQTPPFVSFTRVEWEKNSAALTKKIKNLTWPVFVKPAHLGSSIAIEKIADEKELARAIEVALHYDTLVLVEEGVQNLMDITCAVIGNDNPEASLLQESVFESDLLNYEEKYLKEGGTQLGKAEGNVVIPARIDEQTTEKIREMAKRIYLLAGCSGIARVDFLYNKKTRTIYANEINPLPGTLYHHLWRASGMSLDKLLKKLIAFAKERHQEKQTLTYTFSSDILKQGNGVKGGAKTSAP